MAEAIKAIIPAFITALALLVGGLMNHVFTLRQTRERLAHERDEAREKWEREQAAERAQEQSERDTAERQRQTEACGRAVYHTLAMQRWNEKHAERTAEFHEHWRELAQAISYLSAAKPEYYELWDSLLVELAFALTDSSYQLSGMSYSVSKYTSVCLYGKASPHYEEVRKCGFLKHL